MKSMEFTWVDCQIMEMIQIFSGYDLSPLTITNITPEILRSVWNYANAFNQLTVLTVYTWIWQNLRKNVTERDLLSGKDFTVIGMYWYFHHL